MNLKKISILSLISLLISGCATLETRLALEAAYLTREQVAENHHINNILNSPNKGLQQFMLKDEMEPGDEIKVLPDLYPIPYPEPE